MDNIRQIILLALPADWKFGRNSTKFNIDQTMCNVGKD